MITITKRPFYQYGGGLTWVKKRNDGKNRARKWHMRMYPFSTPSRTSRVFTRLIFFSFRAGLQWTGIVP